MEEISLIVDFLDSELLVIACLLMLAGAWIKDVVSEYYSHYIPFTLWLLGSLLVFLYCVFYTGSLELSLGAIIYSIIQGGVASGVAIGGSQMLIQARKAKEFKSKYIK